jgi:LEA14-like dessication related protein/protein-L-isoaspartate O-methyltransferase
MTVERRLIFSFVLLAAFLAGCETTRDIQYDREPAARLEAMRFGSVELDYATLLFDVEIDNPYPFSLPVRRLSFALVSEGRTFLTATALNDVIMPPGTKKVLTLSDQVIYTRLLQALESKPGEKIPYEADVTLSLGVPRSNWINLQAEKQGDIVLPQRPEIEVEGKTYNAVDVVFVPTPHDVVDKMLELAQVKKDDLVYDLGCGDGRIVVTAAKKYGCKAVGFDIDPRRVKESLENVKKNNVGHLVTIEQKDIFTLDLSDADVITMFLLPSLDVKLIPQLQKLKPGSRIVSHSFAMGEIKPDKVVTMVSKEDQFEHTIYLWTTPLKIETDE